MNSEQDKTMELLTATTPLDMEIQLSLIHI